MVAFETPAGFINDGPANNARNCNFGIPDGVPPNRLAIEAAVAHVFGLKASQIDCSTRGSADAAFARQVAMYVTHVSCGMNLTDVGALFDRDRTTVSHACAVIEERRDDPVLDRVLELLEWIVPELLARSGTLVNQN